MISRDPDDRIFNTGSVPNLLSRRVTYEFSDDLAQRYMALAAGRKKNYAFPLLVAFILFLVFLITTLVSERFGTYAAVFFAGIVACLFVLAFLGARGEKARYLAAHCSLPNRTFTLDFNSEDEMTAETPGGTAKESWNLLERVVDFGRFWELRFGNKVYLVPAEFIDPPLDVFLTRKAIEVGKPVLRPQGFLFVERNSDALISKPTSRGNGAFWIMILVFGGIGVFVLYPKSDTSKTSVIVVAHGKNEFIPISLSAADAMDLSIVVTGGDPIDVIVCPDRKEDGKLVIDKREAFMSENVRTFERRANWGKKDIVIVLKSVGRSEVKIDAVRVTEP